MNEPAASIAAPVAIIKSQRGPFCTGANPVFGKFGSVVFRALTGVGIGVERGVETGVELGVEDVNVAVGDGVGVKQVGTVTVLVSNVTAAFLANTLPSTLAPVVRVIAVIAKIFPLNTEVVPSVAELPTCQKT